MFTARRGKVVDSDPRSRTVDRIYVCSSVCINLANWKLMELPGGFAKFYLSLKLELRNELGGRSRGRSPCP